MYYNKELLFPILPIFILSIIFVGSTYNLKVPILTFSILYLLLYITLYLLARATNKNFKTLNQKTLYFHFLLILLINRLVTDLWVSKNSLYGLGDIKSDQKIYLNIVNNFVENSSQSIGTYPTGYFKVIAFLSNLLDLQIITTFKLLDFVFLSATPFITSYIIYKFIDKSAGIALLVLLTIFYPNEAPFKYFSTLLFLAIGYVITERFWKDRFKIKNTNASKLSISATFALILSLVLFLYSLPIYLCFLFLIYLALIFNNKRHAFIILITISIFNASYLKSVMISASQFLSLYIWIGLSVIIVILFFTYQYSVYVGRLLFLVLALLLFIFFPVDDYVSYGNTFLEIEEFFPYLPLFLFYLVLVSILNYLDNRNNIVFEITNVTIIYIIFLITKSILIVKFYVTTDVSLLGRIDGIIFFLLLIALARSISNLFQILFEKFSHKFALNLVILFIIYLSYAFFRSFGIDNPDNSSSIYVYSLDNSYTQRILKDFVFSFDASR